MVQKCPDGPKGVPNCQQQKHLGLPFRTLLDPFGPLWNVDKPAMFGHFCFFYWCVFLGHPVPLPLFLWQLSQSWSSSPNWWIHLCSISMESEFSKRTNHWSDTPERPSTGPGMRKTGENDERDRERRRHPVSCDHLGVIGAQLVDDQLL